MSGAQRFLLVLGTHLVPFIVSEIHELTWKGGILEWRHKRHQSRNYDFSWHRYCLVESFLCGRGLDVEGSRA